MPTYEYRCPEGHDFETFIRNMKDAQSALACPTCGKEAARQLSAGGGLLFKGSGFYITDYGKDGKKDQRPAKSSTETTAASPATPAPAASTAPATPAPSPKPSTPSGDS
ncbi:MAG: zinc ribbon domain-containing protein [Gemmatimonadaceae bacterium]|nr:zinc ribbon domain-containing protein [Gemmatimonadaceae bacterium]